MKTVKNVLSYIIIILLALLIKEFVFSPIKVNGTSMYPTLDDGDFMILNEIGYHLFGVERFDIVVVKKNGERIIKRVIGLPGEKIEYKDNKLYINDKVIEEDFSHATTHDFNLSELNYNVIPEGYYFVVGDNRTNSLDSRKIGLIKKSEIKGKTSLVFFPFSKFGKVN